MIVYTEIFQGLGLVFVQFTDLMSELFPDWNTSDALHLLNWDKVISFNNKQ